MTDSTQPKRPGSGRTVFHYRDYRLLWVARLMSGISAQMQLVAVGWLVYDITHDPLALGLIGLIAFLPWVALVLVTGQVADRYDRRLILVFAYAVSSAVSFGLFLFALGDPKEVWPIYCFVLVLGITRAFAMPTTSALMPNLVPKEELGHAVAWSSSGQRLAASCIFGDLRSSSSSPRPESPSPRSSSIRSVPGLCRTDRRAWTGQTSSPGLSSSGRSR